MCRYLVAGQDLAAGEVIFVEEALSWAPMLHTLPTCLTCMQQLSHRRRIITEEKAKIVAAVWGTELIQFLAAITIFCTRRILRKG